MADNRGRRTQVQRRADTERRLVDAALSLIERFGSRSVTLAQVGAEAGYSRGIVHHHFGGREKLLTAAVRAAQRFDLPELEGDGLARLEQFVRAYLRNLDDRTSVARAFLRMWAEAIAGDPVLTPLFAELDLSFRTHLGDLVRDGVADGSIRADVDPDATGVLLMALLRGTGLQVIGASPPAEPATLVESAVLTIRHALT